MTDTYRIKPLVWTQGCDGTEYCQAGHLHVAVHPHDYGRWQVDITVGKPDFLSIYSSVLRTKGYAKKHAEFIYRDLLLGALEPIE